MQRRSPKNKKYSAELKKQAVEAYLGGERSQKAKLQQALTHSLPCLMRIWISFISQLNRYGIKNKDHRKMVLFLK